MTGPGFLPLFNKLTGQLARAGLGTTQHLLSVPGRRSGTLRTTPVAVQGVSGRRYIVSVYPDAEWPKNARVAGWGLLRHGRDTRRLSLIELPLRQRPQILAAITGQSHATRWMLRVNPGSSQKDLDRAAREHTIFEVGPPPHPPGEVTPQRHEFAIMTDRPADPTGVFPAQLSDCCIAGCGPAGAILGLLLARAGIDVAVLEKHGDFLRDFRGDTIHPSTLQLLAEMGLADRVLAGRHSEARVLAIETAGKRTVMAEFRRLRSRFPYVAFMPQWDLLDLITSEAKCFPGFHLLMDAEVLDVIEEAGAVRGVRFRDAAGEHELRAPLTVAADGRTSRVRAAAGLAPIERSAPMDVLWFRISRRADEPEEVALRVGGGHLMVLINRFEYWQIAYVIPKGSAGAAGSGELAAFKENVCRLAPELADRIGEIAGWDQVKLLTVRSNRLRRWSRPGLLCIGDAAHAMTPVLGVGINLAIQDAVVAANRLARPLRAGRVPGWRLWEVQLRRELPVRLIQAFQNAIWQAMGAPIMTGAAEGPPALLGLLERFPALRWLPARLIGIGVWQVHVNRYARATPSLRARVGGQQPPAGDERADSPERTRPAPPA